jgi:hypothetical protein
MACSGSQIVAKTADAKMSHRMRRGREADGMESPEDDRVRGKSLLLFGLLDAKPPGDSRDASHAA